MVLLDTNMVFDVLSKRQPHYAAFQILPRAGAEPKRFSQALSPGLG